MDAAFVTLDTAPVITGNMAPLAFWESHIAVHHIMAISNAPDGSGAGILLTDGTLLGCKQNAEEIIAKLEEIARKMGGK